MLFSIFISAGLLFGVPATALSDQTTIRLEDTLQTVTQDTLRTVTQDTLRTVTVRADKGIVISRSDTVDFQNAFDIAGELHQVPGVQIGDYGGYAGIKTVSIRGMGSPHTSVYIDGVRVGNVQSGQGDLGMYDIENYSSAVVDYARNSISFNTARPAFTDGPIGGVARMNIGSFGTVLPSARVDLRISDKLAASANASGVLSDGDYPLADGSRRANNDVRQMRGGINIYGTLDEGDYHIKAYGNIVERGTPGSVSWPSEDRQDDINAYLQAVLKKKFSPSYTLKMSTKAANDRIAYTSIWGDSEYNQKELQVNSAHLLRLKKWLNTSITADIQWDRLASTNYCASRLSAISALTGSFSFERISFNISVEYSGHFDRNRQDGQAGQTAQGRQDGQAGQDRQDGQAGQARHRISPSMEFRIRLTDGVEIVGFGRRACRVPMFNELYYIGYGNPDLRPEEAWLTDLGIDIYKDISSTFSVRTKADGFYNLLRDKITSVPTVLDPNIWQPCNIGKVTSTGVDLMAGIYYKPSSCKISADIRYSFQSAQDRTPGSDSYGQQIPYLAMHTLTADLKAVWRGFTLNPQWVLKSGRSDSTGCLADWHTLDVSLSRRYNIRDSLRLGINISAKNLLNSRYELVSGYPMPGRSLIGGIEIRF